MLVESKSNLARLMATENLVVEQRHVQTAYFDIKNRVLTVPVLNGNLSNEVIDLLLGHEVGHALETPEKGWHDSVVDLKVNRSILNVCEDARIEKKIKRKFPGIRISFLKGYKELMEMDFFGVKDKNLNTLNFIDRVNLYTKGGPAQGIEFTKEEYELVREVELSETFEETVQVAMKIQKFMKEKLITQTVNSTTDEINGEPMEGSTDDDPQIGGNNTTIGENGTQEATAEKDNKGVKENSDISSGGKEDSTKEDDSVESETDKSFREKEKELYEKNNKKDVAYVNIPEIFSEKVIVSHKTLIESIETHNKDNEWFNQEEMRSNFNKFRIESNKVVSHLVKEFEMRKNAEQQSRVKVSKTGELNLSKIYQYKLTDDIFARLSKVPNGKSHGLVMFIDWSGSMHEHIRATIKQLLNLVLFCKKVNIPFDVYAFSTNRLSEESLKIQEKKVGDLLIPNFSLLNILSHRMTTNEFVKMSSYLLDIGSHRLGGFYTKNMQVPDILSLSGTPLNEAIITAFKLVPEFKKQNKLQIVNTVFLTDGDGTAITGKINNYTSKGEDISPSWKTRTFMRDPVTHATVEIHRNEASLAISQTIGLLKLLKQRVGGNLIGFYVARVRDVRSALVSYSDDKRVSKIDEQINEFKKNNFTYLNNIGYDEYYFLRSDKMDTDDVGEFESKTTTTRALVTAFSKYTTGRISNRVVLNKFINLIV